MPNYLDDANMVEKNLYECVYKFMTDNEVSCEEAIYQCDHIIENAYDFISDLYKIIKSELPQFEDEE